MKNSFQNFQSVSNPGKSQKGPVCVLELISVLEDLRVSGDTYRIRDPGKYKNWFDPRGSTIIPECVKTTIYNLSTVSNKSNKSCFRDPYPEKGDSIGLRSVYCPESLPRKDPSTVCSVMKPSFEKLLQVWTRQGGGRSPTCRDPKVSTVPMF